MDINQIIQAIGTVGFPVVMCILVYVTGQKNTKEMVDSFEGAVKEFSAQMQKVHERLAHIEERLEK